MVVLSKEWKIYCKMLGINPYTTKYRRCPHKEKAFKEWLTLNEGYKYFRYMKNSS